MAASIRRLSLALCLLLSAGIEGRALAQRSADSPLQEYPDQTVPDSARAQRSAVPPPDPASPDWGDYPAPLTPPPAPLPLEYSLVGPPRGVIQHSDRQEYRTVVTDPNAVYPSDSVMNLTIDLDRPDGLAPIGLVADHTLKAGEFLGSYRYSHQSFDQNYIGSQQVSVPDVLAQGYQFAPSQLNIDRHLLLLEYGASDDFTWLAQLPFQSSTLDYVPAGGGNYSTNFAYPGDISLTALYALHRWNRQQIHVSLGLSLPVGFMDAQNYLPDPTLPNLPYVIRSGSGTFDILPGLTYRGQTDRWSWGVQSTATIRAGINRLDYRLGNQVDITAWVARRVLERWSTSFRVDSLYWGNVNGADPRLNTPQALALAPTNHPELQAGQRLSLLVGVNYYYPHGWLPAQHLSVEAGLPVFQTLTGPQLGQTWTLTAGWNILF